jgi:hypothetical protein
MVGRGPLLLPMLQSKWEFLRVITVALSYLQSTSWTTAAADGEAFTAAEAALQIAAAHAAAIDGAATADFTVTAGSATAAEAFFEVATTAASTASTCNI